MLSGASKWRTIRGSTYVLKVCLIDSFSFSPCTMSRKAALSEPTSSRDVVAQIDLRLREQGARVGDQFERPVVVREVLLADQRQDRLDAGQGNGIGNRSYPSQAAFEPLGGSLDFRIKQGTQGLELRHL